MCIVSSVSCSFIVNGAPTAGLTARLHRAEERKVLTGVKISKGSPSTSHILFVDDTLFFSKASEKEVTTMEKILEDYELASGQKINMSK
ncbi:hypothetical protein LIER_42094 [Lithospermum erythrorhizon]|uniref:Reverse transcriptase n=1 Tax=Lithospermum erythrorhizon TaxID=34254 RepID=A0AAV3RKZ9_LITER